MEWEIVIVLVYFSRRDFETAGDFSRPVKLEHEPGLWWIREPPIFSVGSDVTRVKAEPAQEPKP
jgi:hypothetical protein